MDWFSPHGLAVLLWCALVAIKLQGLVGRWRRRGGEQLGGAFRRELRRRGLLTPAGEGLGRGR